MIEFEGNVIKPGTKVLLKTEKEYTGDWEICTVITGKGMDAFMGMIVTILEVQEDDNGGTITLVEDDSPFGPWFFEPGMIKEIINE